MRMNVKAPVAQLLAPCRVSAKAVPRGAAHKGLGQSAFLLGSGGHCLQFSARAATPGRVSRLIVEAKKKSVGDLSKGDLEGKTVLVSNLFL